MDWWQKTRSFAEEAARRSQELTKEAAKRSSEITVGSSRLSDIVSEASRRSKEIATEASKRADLIRAEAAKRAEQIKSLAENIGPTVARAGTAVEQQQQKEDLERFGVTEELREFVKGITISTFQDFPLQDDSEMFDIPSESNIRKDLNEWQVKHASLVLSTVKEISKLRYELCPRIMKERKFWRIYFILVNNHTEPYEKRYMENVKLKSLEKVKDDGVKEPSKVGISPKPEAKESNQQSKTSTSSATEQDLDVFLLGGDSDDDPGLSDGDDDLDNMVGSSDDEKEKS